jgi:single-stranded-DNA-specific exonuclease
MLQAVERICEALKKKETILLVGDYDVDGITSTVIIKKNLTKLGSSPFHVIPKRKTEGYGLSEKVLERGLKMGEVDLVIALDCGTNSSNEAKYLEERGIDLIVVDHHQSKEKLPSNAILVNPHLSKDHGEPWRFLCTAGLAFKLIHGMLKKLRQDGDKVALELSPKESIGLSGLGTIADLVPLKNENRILANFGLKYLSQQSGIGVQALLKEAKVENTSLVGEDVAFKIAPRINACGRLDDPDLAISLLLETDPNNCRALAKKMNEYNEERKSIESNLSEEALNQAKNLFSEKPAVVACGEGDAWNPGVVGIVAGKLAHSLCKPCIVLARSESEYKGSGRGVAGVNLMNILNQCKELLTHWGGHPAAVGLSLNEENLEKFKKSFVECVEVETNGKLPEPSLKIAATIKESEIQDSLLDDLNKLAPFGQENPEPVLALKNVLLAHEPKKVGSGNHFQFSVFNGVRNISGIAWNMSENMPSSSTPLDLAFKLRWNHWNGRKTPQMVLEDWKLSA